MPAKQAGPRRAHTWRDAVAGLGGAISSIPDGMACGLLAGVNPVYGLYASSSGAFFGGLATATPLMVVTTTSAAALATGSALESVPAQNRDSALVLLTILGGLLMWAAAALRVARYTRFISHSVMIGLVRRCRAGSRDRWPPDRPSDARNARTFAAGPRIDRGAASVVLIVLVQGVGVGESVPKSLSVALLVLLAVMQFGKALNTL